MATTPGGPPPEALPTTPRLRVAAPAAAPAKIKWPLSFSACLHGPALGTPGRPCAASARRAGLARAALAHAVAQL
jgi:hypothetical protein